MKNFCQSWLRRWNGGSCAQPQLRQMIKKGEMKATWVGGITEKPGVENDPKIVELARFAIDEHNKKTNAGLEFLRAVKVKHQLVAGSIHHLTIETADAWKTKKLLEAKVLERPWENFRSLEEINHLDFFHAAAEMVRSVFNR